MYLSQSQRTIELYTELTTMICDFIGVSRIAQSTEFDYNNTKLNEFYADIISKMHMNKDILVKILELTGNGRLKRGFKFKVQHPVLGYWRLLKKLHRVS